MNGGSTLQSKAMDQNEQPDSLSTRRHQMFPVLTEAGDRAHPPLRRGRAATRAARGCSRRASRSGHVRRVEGVVAISQRDGLGHVVPIARRDRGNSSARSPRFPGRHALVDAHAEEDVETLLMPPAQLRALIIAEADLGERIVRALILRRVGLIESGASGPVLIGETQSAELLRLQNFLRRNGHPHQVVDAEQDGAAAALLEQYGASAGRRPGGLPQRLRAARPFRRQRWGAASACSIPRRTTSSSTSSSWVPDRPGSRPPSMPRPKACASSCSTAGPLADRPAPARASRTTSAFRPGSPVRRWRVAPSSRRKSSAPRS